MYDYHISASSSHKAPKSHLRTDFGMTPLLTLQSVAMSTQWVDYLTKHETPGS